jgi:hypothetical protein
MPPGRLQEGEDANLKMAGERRCQTERRQKEEDATWKMAGGRRCQTGRYRRDKMPN